MRLRRLKRGEKRRLLSPCHIQISISAAVFCGRGSLALLWTYVFLFLICSKCVLCSLHEPSILSCPQTPAGHRALPTRGGGPPFSSPHASRNAGRAGPPGANPTPPTCFV